MMDYDKLVKALRHCSHDGLVKCNECEYGGKEWPVGCEDEMMADAAAAIEDLQKDLTTLQKCYEIADTTVDEVLKQLPKRGEWVEENRRPRSSQFVCSECHRTAYDPQPTRDKAWRKRCRYAYCPNCGAKMEAQDG